MSLLLIQQPLQCGPLVYYSVLMGVQFGDVLRVERKRSRLTQAELGEASGVPRGTIAALESSSESNPRWKTIVALAQTLGVSLDRLAGLPLPKKSAGVQVDRLARLEEQVMLLRRLPRQVSALADAVGTLGAELEARPGRASITSERKRRA